MINKSEDIRIDGGYAISVVIPVFNAEKYLREALDSVLNQNFDSYQLICVDDGSTDHSLEILQSYAKQHKQLTVISQKNLGASFARKTGLEIASGQYVLFVDADDILIQNALKLLYAVATEKNADIVIGNYVEWDFAKNKEKTIDLGLSDIQDINVIHLLDTDSASLCFKLIKYSLLRDRIYHSLRIGEDLSVIYQAAIFAKNIVFISDSVYKYRVHSKSISNTININYLLDIKLALDTVINTAKAENIYDDNIHHWTNWKIRHCIFRLYALPYMSIKNGCILQCSIKEYLKDDLQNINEIKNLKIYQSLTSKKIFISPWYWAKKAGF